MTTRLQLLASLLILGGAVATVALSSDDDPAEVSPMVGDAEGHDHAAMLAAGETMPVAMTTEDARRIGVTFSRAERRRLTLSVVAVGTVALDETGLAVVTPKIDGWIERLHVDFTGAMIAEGDPLFDVYSPAIVVAQEELVLAARLFESAADGRAEENARALLESARRRMGYWDIPSEEIRAIEESREIRRTITLRSPALGTVIEKNVVQGDRIMPGMTTFRIADLSTIWVEADVFEKDMGVVAVGQEAEVTFEAYPGRTYPAVVSYVYPTVSVGARTGRIRLELSNHDDELRPGMYAEVTLAVAPREPALVVPRSAVLATGERSLVFISGEDGALVPREVVTGRVAGREIEILSGLMEGERVVSSSAFLVDAESSLGALQVGGAAGDGPDGGMGSGMDPEHAGHTSGG